jgi:DNA helicase-2/ATP-dependent DNA helicase PcrA
MADLPILSHLNPLQQEAVTFSQGPLLVLAGPGSGKTRVLTHRAAWLMTRKNIAPENILLLTFTNKAAEEMKKRLKKLLKETQVSAEAIFFAGTFHSLCARILRKEGQALGISSRYLIFDEKDQLETIRLALAEIDLSPQDFNPQAILATISQAKNELINVLEYPQYARGYFQTTVARVWLTYQRLLKQYQALDFDDLLLEAVRLFNKNKSVLSKYQNQIQHLLVDEYQDTNLAQYLLTKLLAGRWQNLFAVGDASQAIYGFRGANFRHLMNLKTDFKNLKIINLEQNYRSSGNILRIAHEVIKKNTGHPVLNLWTERKSGEKITLYEASSEMDEALFVVNKILSQNYSHYAVLYRTNAQSRVLEEAFLAAGIPYVIVGGVQFYQRKEIKDSLAYLRLIANPDDEVSLKRVNKLGKRQAQKFFELTEKIKKQRLTTQELLTKIWDATGYFKRYHPKVEQDLARLENLKELLSVARKFPDLIAFLDNVTLIEREYSPERPSKEKSLAAVALMTAHAAKGTEFPVVFLVGMEEGLFPHSRSLMEKEGIEEERRLCYVGVTRAKEKLYLSYSRNRLYFGQHMVNPVSRFIRDIPSELVEFVKPNQLCQY